MRQARTFFIALAAVMAAGSAATPAEACVFAIGRDCFGSKEDCDREPTAAERRAELRRLSEEETQRRLIEGRKRLESGQVDPAAELSLLLVPNIRPVFIEWSMCGGNGEIDNGAGEETRDSLFQAIVAGTSLAGADVAEIARRANIDGEIFSLGPACNEEFREEYAAFLRKTVAPADLTKAWLFLDARHLKHGWFLDKRYRLVRFEGNARAPPVRWELTEHWLTRQVERALRSKAWGRSLAAAADAFWASRANRLSEDAQACPATAAAWESARQRLVAKMLDQRTGRTEPPARRP